MKNRNIFSSKIIALSALVMVSGAGCSTTAERVPAGTMDGKVEAKAAPAEKAGAEKEDPKTLVVDAQARLNYLSVAHLWKDAEVDPAKLLVGLNYNKKSLPADASVNCTLIAGVALGGTTDKFHCEVDDAVDVTGAPLKHPKKIKVRYNNHKVYSTVIESRIAEALGLYSDADQPMKLVNCKGCGPNPFHQKKAADGQTAFSVASVEEGLGGSEIIEAGSHYPKDGGKPTSAWYWRELDEHNATPQRRAEADALRLLAVFLKHNDSKAIQNRILCTEFSPEGTCTNVIAYVHDFGNTLGSDGHSIHPLDLAKWRTARIWSNKDKCVGALKMNWSNGEGLNDPTISEAGRAFLAARLSALIARPESVSSIFTAAHIEKYDDHGNHYTASEWTDAFIARAHEIIDRKCAE